MLNQVRPLNKSFCLQMLCEENYAKFQRLTPGKYTQTKPSPIEVNVVEQAPYTQVVKITQRKTERNTPSTGHFICRIYLDTQSIEVIAVDGYDYCTHPSNSSPKDILHEKWAVNYLLEKWLNFQLLSLNPPKKRHAAVSV